MEAETSVMKFAMESFVMNGPAYGPILNAIPTGHPAFASVA
jgi:hypothetical protein